jgi:hypothetical protein
MPHRRKTGWLRLARCVVGAGWTLHPRSPPLAAGTSASHRGRRTPQPCAQAGSPSMPRRKVRRGYCKTAMPFPCSATCVRCPTSSARSSTESDSAPPGSALSVCGLGRCLTVCSQEKLDVSVLLVILFRPVLSVSEQGGLWIKRRWWSTGIGRYARCWAAHRSVRSRCATARCGSR